MSPGYYSGLPGGIIGSWGRGYSDATAARIHDHLKSLYPLWDFSLAIRKVYPICSADPRRIEMSRVRKIEHISLKLLLEMIGTHGAGSQFINQNAANVAFFENGGKLQIYTETDTVGSIVSLSQKKQERVFSSSSQSHSVSLILPPTNSMLLGIASIFPTSSLEKK